MKTLNFYIKITLKFDEDRREKSTHMIISAKR